MEINEKNLQLLMIEIFKILNGLAPPIINDFVTTRDITLYDPRELSNEGKHTVTYGPQSISYRAPLLWSVLPQH